ncbi:IS1-like element transposase [Candidatus Enterovibrio escicola]|uniref:IS1-like element transposase n=1 Tax=Candidatus Enterovibrio escicola TaxID=1927127 RepID=UPI000BE2B29D
MCCRTIQIGYTYRACQAGVKEQLIEFTMNGSGIHDSYQVLHISINLVILVLENLHHDV